MSAERRNLPAVVEAATPVKVTSLRSSLAVPAAIASAGDHAARRFLEFFAATIRNKNTRLAYYRAACNFFGWLEYLIEFWLWFILLPLPDLDRGWGGPFRESEGVSEVGDAYRPDLLRPEVPVGQVIAGPAHRV